MTRGTIERNENQNRKGKGTYTVSRQETQKHVQQGTRML